jgi:hypothetical protein
MKFIKRLTITVIILLSLGILFRGPIFRYAVEYKSVGRRVNYSVDNQKLVDYIDSSVSGQSDMDIEQIIESGLSLTSRHLNFAAVKNYNDPNELINSKTAHCVGYASFFATTCNYLINKHNMSDKWTAIPHIGNICVFGANIHDYTNSLFFQDHDFVTIENNKTGEVFAVDPTIHDYLFINFITYQK